MLRHLQNHVALPRPDRLRALPRLQAEGLVFQHLCQRSALECAQLAPLRRAWPPAVFLRQLRKILPLHHLTLDVVGLRLRLPYLRRARRLRQRHKDLAQVNLLRLHELVLVLFVVRVPLRFAQLQPAPYLIAHHLLLQNLVPDLRLEVFKAHALLPRRLLQVIQRRHLVLLADLVQPPDHLGVRVQPQLLRLAQQQLLVDHVP